MLIHDARYSMEDHAAHKNQGHSNFLSALEFSAKYEIGRLIFFHMDASYSDSDLDRMQAAAQQTLRSRGMEAKCQLARDGLAITL